MTFDWEMLMSTSLRPVICLALPVLATAAWGSPVTLEASFDRFWYPFATSAGTETTVPIFAALDAVGFDDRDAEFVLGFATQGAVPLQVDPSKIRINSLRVRVVSANPVTFDPPRFTYDPTFDSYRTSLPTTNANYVADSDDGKPIEMFMVGTRNNVTIANLTETTPFTLGSPLPPRENIRSVFPVAVINDGYVDVTNHVTSGFEATPIAIGTIENVSPGAVAAQNSVVTFDIDLTNTRVRQYFQSQLASGKVVVTISSLHPAAGGPGGGSGAPTYPAFYTKENALAVALGAVPSITIDAEISPLIDFNNDGLFPSDDDVITFFNVFGGDTCETCSSIDVNGDGLFPSDEDIVAFLEAFAGCC
jgi:hypothetical protein